ncbi:hypothetical protein DNTS_014226 [Danionella cerebrum]|uniref:Urea transporter n=1 Tax=Danionella cerebrum TaxID=2873325 RepID=A0A553MWE5_9TELE|nr:hypothetical protein DNTS_014226 [Danionella translucida]
MISTGNMGILEKKSPHDPEGRKQCLVSALLYCFGDMNRLHAHMKDQSLALQLLVGCLRGISRVILLNNPVSGAVILSALLLESPWQALLGTLGLLSSTIGAIAFGQDSEEVSSGIHGFNGMLVALLMGVFSSAGDWYWWLLLPVCLGGVTTTFLYSCLVPVLDHWDLPVTVFPFNTIIVLYLACTGTTNPYFPNHSAHPPKAPENFNQTQLHISQLMQGMVLGVGQIFACETLSSSLLILGAVFLFSPILAIDALLGSITSSIAGLSMSVQHTHLYTGLSGFNGALGSMVVGAFFIFNWKTQLLSIVTAYTDIALSNLLGVVGLPASSWAATLTGTLVLLITGKNLREYRIPSNKVTTPEGNLHEHKEWSAANMNVSEA